MNPPAQHLSTNVAAFCATLRSDYGFGIGQREAHDALRALDAIGVTDRERVRCALRLVCCATYAETRAFDRAFDAFFDAPRGVVQPIDTARHTRPGPQKGKSAEHAHRESAAKITADTGDEGSGSGALERRSAGDGPDDATGWQLLRARYSRAAAQSQSVLIDIAQATRMRAAAAGLIRSVRLGRSRRWTATHSEGRFDIRGTLRGSLQTGGDPVHLRFMGHPFRNPRFVVLIDGSRSMEEHSAAVLAFAAALCDRTARAHIFFFSTTLRDVTRDLRAAVRGNATLADLGQAWGGGTKIGANLARFVTDHASRLVSPETLVIVASDGLDVGDVPQLERALRELDRRSAGIVWLNPHAGQPGFAPAARGMRAALPYITLLRAANDVEGFVTLALRIAQTPRIRGRRR